MSNLLNQAQLAANMFGSNRQVIQLTGGIVNITFQAGDIILQRLGGNYQAHAIHDQVRLLQILRNCELPFLVPELIPINGFGYAIVDNEGALWRAMHAIPNGNHNNDYYTKISHATQALAQLHNTLAQLKFKPQYQIPHFHDTHHIIEILRAIQIPSKDNVYKICHQNILNKYEQLEFAFPVPHQLIHGDPKLSNWIFNQDGSVSALIDWDTIMIGSIYIDIADALRSWCKYDGKYDFDLFELICQQYLEHSKILQDTTEVRTKILKSFALITLELAARYLIDCTSNQQYFRLSDDPATNKELCYQKAVDYMIYYNAINTLIR